MAQRISRIKKTAEIRGGGKYDAIVIGSGLGGSVASAVLAHEGLRILVLDKNPTVGGVCAYYEKQGFKIDIGTHMFTRGHKGPFGSIGRRVGAHVPRFKQPRYITELNAMGSKVMLPSAYAEFPVMILKIVYGFRFTPREMRDALRFFHSILTLDEVSIRALDHKTMWDYLLDFTDNPRLIACFGLLLGLYFILPLREVSAGEAIWAFQRMLKNGFLSYPEGGAITIPKSFLDVAERHAAVIRTKAKVTAINVHGGAAKGVTLEDGTVFEAPVVVATTSLRDVVEHLAGPAHFPGTYTERVRSLKTSLIAVQAKIALSRPLVKAGALVGAYSDSLTLQNLTTLDFDQMYGDVTAGRIPKLIPIYAPIPTNFDASLGPKGTQLITACAVAPTTDVKLVDPPEKWVEAMLHALRSMIPGMDDATIFVDTMQVKFIGHWMGKIGAPAVSCGQSWDQVGNRRPPVHTPVTGLYVAGCGAGGRGVGTELAATSGEMAADAVVQDWRAGMLGVRYPTLH